ncbi:subclass B3 metallo-beta-lactamase [Undibacterium fentianense]|uniref:Subclass B3 metallo-beta-lactamase n=1 Tax=Undibacterium fentianense TaxID=2828728 RepID=A0A941E1W6_9BURK|nr:subclass B3 metallo-beta-lactamase [Undibacterium fentianense]MBR7799451.1 subclass B3 metallo-beta-lactamase [Undibacterium fentianense]
MNFQIRPLLLITSIAILSHTQTANANRIGIKMPSEPKLASAPTACKSLDDWNEPTHARRIYGNTWYVGTCGISVVLIATPNGHVLIDSAPEKASEAVRQNILSLGVKLNDIKTILITHEHHDHMGGLASVQAATGAKVLSRSNIVDVLKSGKNDRRDPQFNELSGFDPVANVHAFEDASTITIGDKKIQHLPMSGHAPGGSGWTWQECEKSVCKNLVFADSLGSISDATYRYSAPDSLANALRESSQLVAKTTCDILITGHGTASNLLARLDQKAPLIDPKACLIYAERGAQALLNRLTQEKSEYNK